MPFGNFIWQVPGIDVIQTNVDETLLNGLFPGPKINMPSCRELIDFIDRTSITAGQKLESAIFLDRGVRTSKFQKIILT